MKSKHKQSKKKIFFHCKVFNQKYNKEKNKKVCGWGLTGSHSLELNQRQNKYMGEK